MRVYDRMTMAQDSITRWPELELLKAAIVQRSFDDMIQLEELRDGTRKSFKYMYNVEWTPKRIENEMKRIRSFWDDWYYKYGFQTDPYRLFELYKERCQGEMYKPVHRGINSKKRRIHTR